MKTKNILSRFAIEQYPEKSLDGFWGNIFQQALDGADLSQPETRITMIDTATRL